MNINRPLSLDPHNEQTHVLASYQQSQILQSGLLPQILSSVISTGGAVYAYMLAAFNSQSVEGDRETQDSVPAP